ncbi:alpha/beta fold hydrolase [Heyndrickxia ginsengihumi]|uniref:2-hydroxy-6-oxo-6-phenylhexa-2,4-dienoate hydrolase n=1 Tax=Heyndrickxia ginsengihumi TaxID=363870 RepID=A0A0A6VFN1_9BACI|nr:alpha/beta hydrolase [Heyndrickxia ginsengihumi]KHD86248.1 2-hydroxy-6-oxo-6-phenylhexa-2,4-dienoate hydrolase [Heyndrickxia ginsengihumi]MBE6184776.1 alpha/beta hydrolase [Bacillus sp. (in: firmicutes)]MCM3024423.1 alpha/beta hydrolase [Heyndrickxia ginsengihumi]NEY20231.1 alpha/beta hydrolase [Heyndrickxia ginsengihumi]
MAYCKVRIADIYYEDIGEGMPIIMLHGFTPDHRLMIGCMEPIFTERDRYRRIYLDLPGMGLTKSYHDINSTDDMLNVVLDFIQTILPNQPYLIVGESYGGYLARGIIEKDKGQILGAAFICPVIFPLQVNRTVETHKVMISDETLVNSLSIEELAEFRNNQVILDEYNWLRYRNEILAGCKIADEQFLNNIKHNYAFSFKIDQSTFNKPSLFLLGRQDSSVGYKDALSLINNYTRATFAVLDTAGHNLQIEQPQLFTSHINEWLDRVDINNK